MRSPSFGHGYQYDGLGADLGCEEALPGLCADVAAQAWFDAPHGIAGSSQRAREHTTARAQLHDHRWRIWEQAAYDYDSSLGFAERIGFRCGICCEYQPYDLHERRPLELRERPLLVMDRSLFSPSYMGLTYEAAHKAAAVIKERCRIYRGDFTVLWHNTEFDTPGKADFYSWLVS